MPEKLTNNDAQEAIMDTPFRKEFDARMPVSERAQKLVDLINAQEVKVFHNEGEVVYSEPVDALDVQTRNLHFALNVMGEGPKQGVKFEGANGESITFECYFGGREKRDEVKEN